MASKDDFRYALADLQSLLDNAKNIPLTKMIAVDETSALQLFQALNDNLPDAMKECESVIQNQDQILEEARQEKKKAADLTKKAQMDWENTQHRIQQAEIDLNAQAQQFLDTARTRAAQQESSIIAEARNCAAEIVAKAQSQAETILSEAQAKADQLVSEEEITVRATKEAAALRESTQTEMEKLCEDVHRELDDILVQMDRIISEDVTRVRAARQQLTATFDTRRQDEGQ